MVDLLIFPKKSAGNRINIVVHNQITRQTHKSSYFEFAPDLKVVNKICYTFDLSMCQQEKHPFCHTQTKAHNRQLLVRLLKVRSSFFVIARCPRLATAQVVVDRFALKHCKGIDFDSHTQSI